jgi:hypothetical protein
VKKLLIYLFIFNFSGAFGQSMLRLGISIDPIVSWFTVKSGSIEKDGARPGINGGLVIERYFHPNYGFVTGLSISSMGGNLLYRDSVTIHTGDQDYVKLKPGSSVSYNVSYITLPIAIKLKSNEIGYFTYFAQIGFLPQINIGSKARSTGSHLNKDSVPDEISLVNLSYFFGGGIEYNIGGHTSLMAGVFFNNGFADILSNNHQKAALNFLSLRIGMLF